VSGVSLGGPLSTLIVSQLISYRGYEQDLPLLGGRGDIHSVQDIIHDFELYYADPRISLVVLRHASPLGVGVKDAPVPVFVID